MLDLLPARFDFTQQPHLGYLPVTRDSIRRHVDSGCGFIEGQASEKPKLDDTAFTLIDFPKSGERLIERHNIRVGLWRGERDVIQRDLDCAAAALLIKPGASAIDENAAHHACSHSEEMGSVLPADLIDIDQTQISLINK